MGKESLRRLGVLKSGAETKHEVLSRVLRGRGVTTKLVFFHELDVRFVPHGTAIM